MKTFVNVTSGTLALCLWVAILIGGAASISCYVPWLSMVWFVLFLAVSLGWFATLLGRISAIQDARSWNAYKSYWMEADDEPTPRTINQHIARWLMR